MNLEQVMSEVNRRVSSPETQSDIIKRFVEISHFKHIPGIEGCGCDYCSQLMDYVIAKKAYHRLLRLSGWDDGGYGKAGRHVTKDELKKAHDVFEREKKLHQFLKMM